MIAIYSITNTVNNKKYIGACKNTASRWDTHKCNLKKENRHKDFNKHLHADGRIYGVDVFKFEIIEIVFGKEELIKREQYYLDQYFDYKVNCYNICPTAGNSLGRVFSEETKAKISAKAKGRKAPA